MEIEPHPEGRDWLHVKFPEHDAEFEIWGDCPVQALGTVGGRDLYFRARNKEWSFDVADHAGNLPSDGYRESDGFYREGEFANAGEMPFPKAINIIENCLREYISQRA